MNDTPEATSLLVSARVDGLRLRSRDGDSIGQIHAMMVDKGSGTTRYAVLALGGFLGMGKSFYPLPFELLAYDPGADDYVVTIDRRVLEGGPSWSNNAPDFTQAYADRVSGYYQLTAARVDRTDAG
ncbi:PRC-barrel domain-containing protein [Sphingomonas sp. RS6]